MNLSHGLANWLTRTQKSRAFGSTHVRSQRSPAKSLNIFEFDRTAIAHQVFDEIPGLDVVKATAVIGRFLKQNRYEEALNVFKRLFYLNIRPNEFTFGTVIGSSTSLGDVNWGKQLHACALKMGLASNVFVGSSVLDCYVKLSTLEEARRSFEDTHEPNVVTRTNLISGYLRRHNFEEALCLFRTMPETNVVSWNAMISGCSQTGRNEEAMNLFIEMLGKGLVPNESTFPCAITAVSNIASHGAGKSFHACAIKFLGQQLNVFVGNSLISFYAKCGNMEDSLLVFNKLQGRNVVSWNAVICGYARNGKGNEAVIFFDRMSNNSNLRPNSVTLLGLLWACNHAGLVNQGYLYFKKARNNEPEMLKSEHYACMLDLLSRSGRFEEAEEFIRSLPFDPGIGFWKALLGGCQIHSNNPLSKLAASKIMELHPGDVSSYVMISNTHSAARRWQNVSEIRREMREKGLKRIPGCSWIELRSKVHVFVTGDKNHELKHEVYGILRVFGEHLSETEPFSLAVEQSLD